MYLLAYNYCELLSHYCKLQSQHLFIGECIEVSLPYLWPSSALKDGGSKEKSIRNNNTANTTEINHFNCTACVYTK